MADLIDIETYKQARGLTGTKDDERLGILVVSVSQLIKTYCNNSIIDFYTDPYTEYTSVEWATDFITLQESPVITVTEVWERAKHTDAYTQLTADDFVLNRKLDSLIRVGGLWPIGVESVEVLYTAGYETVPADLRLAVVDLITYYYKDEYKANRSLQSATIKNQTTSTIAQSTNWPDHIKRILDLYRNIE